MRRASKVDSNQKEIVSALRKIGCSVQPLHSVGKGCPDLLVGTQGQNILMELKDGELAPSRRRLKEDQIEWHSSWRGQVVVIESVYAALEYVKKSFLQRVS